MAGLVIPDRAAIVANEALIRPHVRRTPVLAVDGGDVGVPGLRCVFKLEFLQHACTTSMCDWLSPLCDGNYNNG